VPEWALSLLVFLVIAGFPLAIILAWAFELTPDGIRREKEIDPAESDAQPKSRKLDFAMMGLMALGLVYFAVDKFVLKSEPETARSTTETVPAAEPVAREMSIAVLAFANMSDDAGNEYFSHGISEELLNSLTRVTSLRVASRTSSFSFAGTNTAIPEIAAQLNVNHILEGSVRKAGNRVRITAQLIDVESGFHLWSDTYDRELDDIFSIQKEIAEQIVAELMQTLNAEEVIERSIAPSTTDTAAYEIYLQGRYLLAQRGDQNLEEAARLFERAVEIDSSFAAAYAALGKAYALLPAYRSASDSRMYTEKSEAAIDAALRLDPDQSEALIARGFNATYFRWKWDEASAAFERALRVNPNDAEVHNLYGDYFGIISDFANAEKFERRAMELDVLASVHASDLAALMVSMGRYDEAVVYAERAWKLQASENYLVLAWSHIYLENFDAARQVIVQMEALPGVGSTRQLQLWIQYYLAQGDRDRARPYYDKLKKGALSDEASAAIAASFALELEGVEAALELMELAYVRRDIDLARDFEFRLPEERSTDPRWLAFWEKPGLKELVELRRANRSKQHSL
jgi:TolB-like protein/Flp pilus assembly protein TadD